MKEKSNYIMEYAPIALFAFDRPYHTEQTLEALSRNKLADKSSLFVFLDGPKKNASEEQINRIQSVYKLFQKKYSFKEIQIVKRSSNKGLADSIVEGVTEVVNRFGKVIVLEDDIVTSPGFLNYMNSALDMYENEKQVMQVSGYIYPNKLQKENGTSFLKIMSCWGWATWKDRWEHYEHDAEKHVSLIDSKQKIKKFDIEGDAYFSEQLSKNSKGDLYTWAVRWYASWFGKGGTCLYPHKSLVKNIGHDGTGENCNENDVFFDGTVDHIDLTRKKVKENVLLRKQINHFFKINFLNNKKAKNINILTFIKRNIRVQLRKALFFNNPLISFNNYFENSKKGQYVKLYSPYEIRNTVIGDFSYISKNAQISNTSIGKFCSIGPNLLSGWGIHPTQAVSTSPIFYSTKKQNGISFVKNGTFIERKNINIGNDVFIGANVTILDGVAIGDGAIIGAGAIVSKDIPPFSIAAGNPVEILKYRFSNDKIEKLLKLEWWNWPPDKIKEITKDFYDIDQFLEKNYDQKY